VAGGSEPRDYAKGVMITFLGVLVISPDTLLLRLIEGDTWMLLFWRGALSGIAIMVWFVVVNGTKARRMIADTGWGGAMIGAVFSLGSICFVYSATHTLVANTLFITSTSPVFAALIAWLVLGERVGLRTWVTILVTLTGIGVIAAGSFGADSKGGLDGDLAALGAALALAVTFSIARARRGVSMVPAMALAAFLTAAVAAVLSGSLAVPQSSVIWVALLGLGVVPLGVALLATGPRYIPAADVSLILLLEAVFGPVLVWLVLGELPGAATWIGGAIVLGALAISNMVALRARRRNARA